MDQKFESELSEILDVRSADGRTLFMHIRDGHWGTPLMVEATSRLEALPRPPYGVMSVSVFERLVDLIAVAFYAKTRWLEGSVASDQAALDMLVGRIFRLLHRSF